MLGKYINIIGTKYKVRKCKDMDDVDTTGERRSLCGQISYSDGTISVYEDKNNLDDFHDTILHEVFHGVANHLFRNRPDIMQVLSDESIVDPLVSSYRDTLERNNLVKWTMVKEGKKNAKKKEVSKKRCKGSCAI